MNKRGFFEEGSRSWFLDAETQKNEREKLAILGCKFLSVTEANEIRHQAFFDTLSTRQASDWPLYEALPVFEDNQYAKTPIPYDVFDHFDHSINGKAIAAIVENHINENFSNQKYIFSCDPGNCLALSFDHFSYEILYSIESSNLNNPFAIFDEGISKCFLLHFDLNITIYIRREPDLLGGLDDSTWINYFNRHFLDGIEGEEAFHVRVINTNYVPRLPGTKPFSHRTG